MFNRTEKLNLSPLHCTDPLNLQYMSLYEQWEQGTEDCDNGGHPRAQVQPVQGQVILDTGLSLVHTLQYWALIGPRYNTGL